MAIIKYESGKTTTLKLIRKKFLEDAPTAVILAVCLGYALDDKLKLLIDDLAWLVNSDSYDVIEVNRRINVIRAYVNITYGLNLPMLPIKTTKVSEPRDIKLLK
jgi:biotin carboxylase